MTTLGRSQPPNLPGVYFTSAAAPRPLFPRLDVAGFVGYAQRGPTDLAVAIEDPRQYEAVFGGDLVLARDERSRPVFAHLPSAVRAFFANGGRRCHVVRVAGANAVAARFGVPGLLGRSSLGDLRIATVDAASVGRWANGSTLSSRLDALPLPARDVAIEASGLTWRGGATRATLQAGDLLRVRWPGGATWLVAIAAIEPHGQTTSDVLLGIAAAWPLGLAAAGVGGTGWRAGRLTPAGVEPFGSVIALDETSHATAITVLPDAAVAPPRTGDVLVLDPTAPGSGASSVAVGIRSAGPLTPDTSPPSGVVAVEGDPAVVLERGSLPTAPFGGLASVERLRFELRLHGATGDDVALRDLAFGPGGARFWLDVVFPESARSAAIATGRATGAPVTEAFLTYRSGRRPRDQRVPVLDRSTLAGLLAPSPDAGGPTFLPVGMPALLDGVDAPGPVVWGSDDLATHEPEPFLDPVLANAPPARLMAQALALATVDERRIDGMHALTLVDEVALIAIPDAAHRPWRPADAVFPVLAPPAVPPAPLAPCPNDEGFEDCDRPPTVTAITPDWGFASVATPVVIQGSGFLSGPVEVLVGDQPAETIVVLRDDVLTCTVPVATSSPPGVVSGAVDVVVRNPDDEASLSLAFAYVPDPVDPSLPELVAHGDPDADGQTTLLAVQAPLVRLCHGRADAVAILDLPARHHTVEAGAWQADLRRALGLPPVAAPVDGDLPVDLSYAAAYHPWLLVATRDDASPPRATPPSGAVAGLIASRELSRGAWIAPANDALRGVRGLDPDLTRDEWASLFAASVNLVRREAEDFRPMSAHTLADLAELRQVSVRRLLILLRKAALEQGMDYAFETNHERFRDGVGAMLRTLLRRMHEAGAFAGVTPEQAFRVDTGAAVNPPASVDQGRFVALVQVAPSQPAEFLTVELTRTGQGVLQVSGA